MLAHNECCLRPASDSPSQSLVCNFHLPSSWLCAVCILALWWPVCLFPPRLGAWQFLADMPYGSISLTAVWKVFWSLYSNHTDPTLSAYQTASGHHDSGSVERDGVAAERGRSPETVEEIQQAMKSESRILLDVYMWTANVAVYRYM